MTEVQAAVAHVARLALVVLLVGMLWRGRVRECWAFGAYVLAVLLGNSLVSLWPSRFFTPAFWVAKQGVYDILKAAIALELAWRAFQVFPGALRTARVVLLALLSLSTASLLAIGPRSAYAVVWEWQPAVATAGLWLLTATALMVVWYQVPLTAWQRAIMVGLSVYLLVFVTLLSQLGRRGWSVGGAVAMLETLAYLALVTFWAWTAWQPKTAGAAAPSAKRAA
jgi:hypothetical protein